LNSYQFFYITLDEGHRIKNAKSKTTKAAKGLNAERKLMLSGTPLQNKVSELWSIFDFLMPNFLEEEGVFNKLYN
jgi:TATA-binding protein-associated factor